jgi:ClpA/ClpB-like protein
VLERFSDAVLDVCDLANAEAERLRHDYLGPEHILAGLAAAGDTGARASSSARKVSGLRHSEPGLTGWSRKGSFLAPGATRRTCCEAWESTSVRSSKPSSAHSAPRQCALRCGALTAGLCCATCCS